MLPRAATEFYALQQRVNATATREIGRIWRRMGDDFDASWRRLSPQVLAVLVEAQNQVAMAALDYVPRVLADTGLPDVPSGELRPSSLVGIASDGRPLTSLAYGGVVQAKQSVGAGAPTGTALANGGQWMDLMARLQIADTARQAVGVMTASRKTLSGTVRVLNPPSCQRCAILAGRVYRWSTGFQRHPRCDCVNLPVQSAGWARAEGFLTDPMDAYRRGEIRDLTEAQRFAIDNGADIARVVNATPGMSTTVTDRGLSARKIHLAEKRAKFEAAAEAQRQASIASGMPDLMAFAAGLPRATAVPTRFLTPEGIYQQAKDRDDAIRLLRHWGYLD
jgi:hypothetical protein